MSKFRHVQAVWEVWTNQLTCFR